MKKIVFAAGIIFSILMQSCSCPKAENNSQTKPNEKACKTTQKCDAENLLNQQLTLATVWYQKSAEMRALYHQCYNWAKIALDQNIAKADKKSKKAVIVDIDETILDNSPFEVKCIETGKGYTKKTWQEWTAKGKAKALPGAVDFLNYAKSKGAEIFYISNRRVEETDITIKNLIAKKCPFADKKHVILRSETSDKTKRRASVKKDYEIVLLVGDNLTDYSQIFGERGKDLGFNIVKKHSKDFGTKFIMLPNPMYGEWEGAIYDNNYKLSPKQKLEKRKQILDSH